MVRDVLDVLEGSLERLLEVSELALALVDLKFDSFLVVEKYIFFLAVVRHRVYVDQLVPHRRFAFRLYVLSLDAVFL